MSIRKSRALELVHHHLETTCSANLRALLSPTTPSDLSIRAAALQELGLLTLLTKEVQELRLGLYFITQACHYGQSGQEPTDYEGDTPYDAYHAILVRLSGEAETIACWTLSESLQAYIAAIPPLECTAALHPSTQCVLPSHAFGPLACSRAQLHQLAYFAQDMAHLQTLVQQRGAWEQILAWL